LDVRTCAEDIIDGFWTEEVINPLRDMRKLIKKITVTKDKTCHFEEYEPTSFDNIFNFHRNET
jgi:hypothetical protein